MLMVWLSSSLQVEGGRQVPAEGDGSGIEVQARAREVRAVVRDGGLAGRRLVGVGVPRGTVVGAIGEGQLYEVTDPAIVTAYTEAHLEPSGIEIANPADYYEAAAVPSQEPAPAADLDRDLTPALDL